MVLDVGIECRVFEILEIIYSRRSWTWCFCYSISYDHDSRKFVQYSLKIRQISNITRVTNEDCVCEEIKSKLNLRNTFYYSVKKFFLPF